MANILSTVIEVLLTVTVLPTLAVTIAGTQNLTATEAILLGLVTTVIIMGLIYGIAKQQGFIKGK